MEQLTTQPGNMNLVIWLVLFYRALGWKHSDIDWKGLRRAYDYLEAELDLPDDSTL